MSYFQLFWDSEEEGQNRTQISLGFYSPHSNKNNPPFAAVVILFTLSRKSQKTPPNSKVCCNLFKLAEANIELMRFRFKNGTFSRKTVAAKTSTKQIFATQVNY